MTSTSTVVQWFATLGISNVLTTDDILSGNAVHTLMRKTVSGYKNDLVTPASAVNKIANWNNLIKSLQKINIKVSNQQKNLIFQGRQSVVYDILSQVKSYVDQNTKQVEVDINKIDHRSDPKNSKSLLQLFILVIIKNLGLNAKQSVALLSNDSKYLAHILAKGFKDQSRPVLNLLKDFHSLLPKIRQFCINKENQVFFLKSIKPGLISKFIEVSQLSLTILQEFALQSQNPFQLMKVHLIGTFVLQYRRHSILSNTISNSILRLSKYNKGLLTILTNNMNQKQLLSFTYEILCISEENNQLRNFYALSKVEDIVSLAIQSLNESTVFWIGLCFLIKVASNNMELLANDMKGLNNMLNNLEHLSINKSEHLIGFINGMFALLQIFARQKHPISPQIFRLCVQKYKLAINEQESTIYAQNLLLVIEQFPSIPTTPIVDSVIERYENYKEVTTDLDLRLLIRIAYGYNPYVNQLDQQNLSEEKVKIPDQTTALRIYNLLSNIFFEQVSNSVEVVDTILYILQSHTKSQPITDHTLKFMKVSLAVHYANLRKLNMSKSIVQGIVKIDSTNALPKRKNLDIEYLLKNILQLKNQQINKNIQPLICYSYIQSSVKNKTESQGLYNLLSIIGNPKTLIQKYEEDVKILHDQKKSKKKSLISTENQQQTLTNVNSAADLLKRKKLLSGQNYSMYLSRIQKVTPDAKNGLLKAQKVFQDKMKKIQLQEIRKLEEQKRKEELQRKFTLKVLQKGIRVDPKIDTLHQYLYEFNVKEKQLLKDISYDLTSLHIFNPAEEQENDLQGLKYLMKKYNRVLKVFYSNYGGKLRPNSISLFEQIAQKQSLMTVANVWKLFKDYQLDQFMTIREAQFLVQKINSQKKKSYYDTSLLDFEAFQDFIIQASLTMFSRPPKNLSRHSISEMVEETFYQFKMLAGENKIDTRLFDQDLNSLQQDQMIASLNNQLKNNPDYILPEGYKKIVDKKVEFFHNIALDAFNGSYTDVLDILDEIIFDKLGFHILEPFSEVTTNVYAKSLLSKKKQEKTDDFKEKYFSLNVKKQLFKYSGQDRAISRQVAFCLSDIVEAIQQGKKSIFKVKYTAKQLQEQKRKADEQLQKKRQKRDLQLKKILEKHKAEKQIKQKQKSLEKQTQEKKLEEEKKKKQKYDQDLKRKVEQYQQKRQQHFKKQEQQRIKQKKKQQQQFEKRRQQLSKVAKQIQEKKEKEKKQLEQRQQKQKQLLMKQKSKKNIKIRSSPMPKKKLQEVLKTPTEQIKKQRENKSLASSPKEQN